jgi:simple sugar transport system permease protein
VTRLRGIGFAVLAPVIAVLIAMLATSLVIVSTGSQSGVGDFWRIILTKPEDRILVNIVNQTTMIYLSAVAAAVGFRMGLFNIGVEGQYTLASYTAATFAGAAYLPGALNVFATLVIAMAVGAAWAGIAGILRTTRGVSEVISTIMLNAIAAIIVGYLLDRYGIHGGNSVRTASLQSSSHVPGWTPFTAQDGPIWGMALLAIGVGIAFWVLLN